MYGGGRTIAKPNYPQHLGGGHIGVSDDEEAEMGGGQRDKVEQTVTQSTV